MTAILLAPLQVGYKGGTKYEVARAACVAMTANQWEDDALNRFACKANLIDPAYTRSGVPGKEPDFVTIWENKIIGIELTQYLYGQAGNRDLQQVEAQERRCMDEAQRLYKEAGSPSISVWVQWIHGPDFEVAPTARAIVDAVKANVPDPGEGLIRKVVPVPVGIDEVVANITVLNHGALWSSTWSAIVDAASSVVQKCIDAKGTKLKIYRQRCDAVWLLIHATGVGQAAYGLVSDEACQHVYKSGFDRVFLLDAEGGLCELPLHS